MITVCSTCHHVLKQVDNNTDSMEDIRTRGKQLSATKEKPTFSIGMLRDLH